MKPRNTLCALGANTFLAGTLILTAAISCPAQQRGARKVAPRKAIAAASAPEQKYKGIWEPVNYPDDVTLLSVYFVSEKEGWAAGKGKGGIILHTADGGEHWDIQLGDPDSNEENFDHLHFLDASHGWAVQRGGKLLRTSDGTNWEEAGSLPGQFKVYQFVSPRNGIETGGFWNDSKINVTADGGRRWKPVYQCATTLQVEGLTKRVGCYLEDLQFPSARVGYSVGGGFNGGFAVVAKTVDGGATWKLIFASTDMETAESVFFTDETNGVMRLKDRKVFVTSDGGQSWHGIPASASGPIKFADPETGASCARNACIFTGDGGQHWLSREFRFPASVESFSIPRRDRIYAAGDHGMVYRYRIVPADFMAKGSIDAPLLSSYGGAIHSQLSRLKDEVQQLQAKIASAGGAPNSAAPTARTPSNTIPSKTGASATGQPRNQIPAQNAQASEAEAQPFSQDSSAGGGFSQDTPAGADSQSAAGAAAFSQDTGFSQDVLSAPPSQPLQDCCKAQMQSLQTDLNLFSQQAPAFAGKYRNLNLLFVGLNMLSDLMGKARNMRNSFLALKQAHDLPTAAAALQDLAAKLDSTSQSVTSGFQNLTAGSNGSGGAGAVNNMLADPSGAQTTQDPSAEANQMTDSPEQQKEDKKKSGAGDILKKKLKRKIPF